MWTPGVGFCLTTCSDSPPTPPPERFRVDVRIDPSDPTGMTVIATVIATPDGSPVDIDWMDGSRNAPVAVGESVTHPYASPGTYQVTSFLLDFSEWVTTEITVPSNPPTERTWADVMSTWPTWGDIDAPTWNDLKNGT